MNLSGFITVIISAVFHKNVEGAWLNMFPKTHPFICAQVPRRMLFSTSSYLICSTDHQTSSVRFNET